MGLLDKAKNKAQGLRGKAKERAGEANGDKDMQAQGRADQTKSDLKDAGEKIKDAFS